MEVLPSFASFALPATVLLLLTLLGVRLRQRFSDRRERREKRDALDTLAAWPPEAARVLTVTERQAYDLLKRSMPGYLVLGQVPISRFIRVPARHSYTEWLQRVGALSADLLLCDAGSRVLAVIDIRSPQESERSRRRHERMTRVLRKAGIHVLTWREDALPTASEVRHAMTAVVGGAAEVAKVAAGSSRPMLLIPVADISEVLAEGDLLAIFPEGGITRDGTLGEFKGGVMKVLQTHPVPVIPMALTNLWGSFFSRIEQGTAMRKPFRRGFYSPVGLEVGAALPASEVTPDALRRRVQSLLAAAR